MELHTHTKKTCFGPTWSWPTSAALATALTPPWPSVGAVRNSDVLRTEFFETGKVGQISIFSDKVQFFRTNFNFFGQISIFWTNFNFSGQISFFGQISFLDKFQFFGQILIFRQISIFSDKFQFLKKR
jgi:hypothetical protein